MKKIISLFFIVFPIIILGQEKYIKISNNSDEIRTITENTISKIVRFYFPNIKENFVDINFKKDIKYKKFTEERPKIELYFYGEVNDLKNNEEIPLTSYGVLRIEVFTYKSEYNRKQIDEIFVPIYFENGNIVNNSLLFSPKRETKEKVEDYNGYTNGNTKLNTYLPIIYENIVGYVDENNTLINSKPSVELENRFKELVKSYTDNYLNYLANEYEPADVDEKAIISKLIYENKIKVKEVNSILKNQNFFSVNSKIELKYSDGLKKTLYAEFRIFKNNLDQIIGYTTYKDSQFGNILALDVVKGNYYPKTESIILDSEKKVDPNNIFEIDNKTFSYNFKISPDYENRAFYVQLNSFYNGNRVLNDKYQKIIGFAHFTLNNSFKLSEKETTFINENINNSFEDYLDYDKLIAVSEISINQNQKRGYEDITLGELYDKVSKTVDVGVKAFVALDNISGNVLSKTMFENIDNTSNNTIISNCKIKLIDWNENDKWARFEVNDYTKVKMTWNLEDNSYFIKDDGGNRGYFILKDNSVQFGGGFGSEDIGKAASLQDAIEKIVKRAYCR